VSWPNLAATLRTGRRLARQASRLDRLRTATLSRCSPNTRDARNCGSSPVRHVAQDDRRRGAGKPYWLANLRTLPSFAPRIGRESHAADGSRSARESVVHDRDLPCRSHGTIADIRASPSRNRISRASFRCSNWLPLGPETPRAPAHERKHRSLRCRVVSRSPLPGLRQRVLKDAEVRRRGTDRGHRHASGFPRRRRRNSRLRSSSDHVGPYFMGDRDRLC